MQNRNNKSQPRRYKGRKMGIITSGGDSQGMNAAIRSCVYFIYEGFKGLVHGDDHFVKVEWSSVSNIIQIGGTVIGSSRSAEFVNFKGRLKAAYNLVIREITHLVIIGGDGSLTGANLFRQEWSDLLNELYNTDQISFFQREKNYNLHIVGIVGSIDNDFCGTEMTIGANSAMHRIIEAIDAASSTTLYNEAIFIIEVMGKHCGYLSLTTGLCTEADFIFIPENPPKADWKQRMCEQLSAKYTNQNETTELIIQQKKKIIIICEGAVDRNGNIIRAEDVRKCISNKLHKEANVTVLGHIQRGGNPSAFDRILASRMGARAVIVLMSATAETESCIISIKNNRCVLVSLLECVEKTQAVQIAMTQKNWEMATKLRGDKFEYKFELYKTLVGLKPLIDNNEDNKYRYGIMHVGSVCPGMNAAVYGFVRSCIQRGDIAVGIYDGFYGLLEGKVKEIKWADVTGWVPEGGAILGICDKMPENKFNEIAARLKQFNINGLLLIGGFDAFLSCIKLSEKRSQYPEFCIPILLIPATINNNIPGTEVSIGCDTSLNTITNICDRIRQSAQGSKNRVFVIETIGGYCGYLTTFAGLAGSADVAYIYENKYTIKDLKQDLIDMGSKIKSKVARGFLIINENASVNYNADFIRRLYAEEGKGLFSCRMNVLGHVQQGGSPTPLDRIFGINMGANSAFWFAEQMKNNLTNKKLAKYTKSDSVGVIGLSRKQYGFKTIEELIPITNFQDRLPKVNWWLDLCPLVGVLGKHPSAFQNVEPSETVDYENSFY